METSLKSKITPTHQPAAVQAFNFVLLPQFSLMGFVSAIEPLRVANRFNAASYHWRILSLDGNAVVASNGMTIQVDGAFNQLDAQSASWGIIVVAGFNPLQHSKKSLESLLRLAQQHGVILGAIDTGAFILAQAGVIGKNKITLHWEARTAFTEMFPKANVTDELYEISNERLFCAGGTASLDMMLALIERDHGRELATKVSEQFVLERMRKPSEHQRLATSERYHVHNIKVIKAVALMEQYIETPLALPQLANQLNISARQLERLFEQYLQQSPAQFYMQKRLERAQQLLAQTSLSVLEISIACGFSSVSHFSRTFSKHFDKSPSVSRKEMPSATLTPSLKNTPSA